MAHTKNQKHVYMDKSMVRMLCRRSRTFYCEKIQERYIQLKDAVGKIEGPWVKIHGEDLYLNTRLKVLVPDTTKMKATYLNCGESFKFYGQLVSYAASLPEEKKKKMAENAETDGAVMPEKPAESLHHMPARLLTRDEARDLFLEPCPMMEMNQFLLNENSRTDHLIVSGGILLYMPYNTISELSNARYALNLSVHWFDKSDDLFSIATDCGLIPDCLKEEDRKDLKTLYSMKKDGVDFEDVHSIESYIVNGGIKECMGFPFAEDLLRKDLVKQELDLSAQDGWGRFLRDYLDSCDYIRARIKKYSSRQYLTDESRGHWELWNPESREEKEEGEEAAFLTVAVKGGVIARNPSADINLDAVVGIDFGTKSTTAVILDGNREVPLRIGMGDYRREAEQSDYENPTVIQCRNLDAFIQAYKEKEGRPYTSWDDVKVSHEAFGNMLKAKESQEYVSYISDLKQWAAGRYKNDHSVQRVVRDCCGHRFELGDYLKLTEEDMDPIQYYAYYLGLYINNMHTGICLDYIMSFPETFSDKLRKKILQSFRSGIRKSLPAVIFEDKENEDGFRVRQGPTEPAAYAVCALDRYGIEATEKGVFYGVFDFGGGTTDFDFGLWKSAAENDDGVYSIVEHFGSAGMESLGGENLLELLAYQVFSDDCEGEDGSNLRKIRDKGIVYYRPAEGKLFPGAEALLSSEENAVLNTKQMMEVLRPIWEEHPVVRNWMEAEEKEEAEILCGASGSLLLHEEGNVEARVNLFSESGMERFAETFRVDMEMLDLILTEKIKDGVNNFLQAMENAFSGRKDMCGSLDEPVHIFLAGNSCKSRRVERIFRECIANNYGREAVEDPDDADAEESEVYSEGESEEGSDADEEVSENSAKNLKFLLFPPLGTPRARKIQSRRNVVTYGNELMEPTGKTGVAFGLVMSREGSGIKIISEQKKNTEIKPNYYIGMRSGEYFRTMIGRTVGYNEWIKFRKADAELETFEFYYTDQPGAAQAGARIKISGNPSVYRKKCLVNHSEDGAAVYMRFTGPATIEYVVSTEEKIGSDEYVSNVRRIEL